MDLMAPDWAEWVVIVPLPAPFLGWRNFTARVPIIEITSCLSGFRSPVIKLLDITSIGQLWHSGMFWQHGIYKSKSVSYYAVYNTSSEQWKSSVSIQLKLLFLDSVTVFNSKSHAPPCFSSSSRFVHTSLVFHSKHSYFPVFSHGLFMNYCQPVHTPCSLLYTSCVTIVCFFWELPVYPCIHKAAFVFQILYEPLRFSIWYVWLSWPSHILLNNMSEHKRGWIYVLLDKEQI